MVFPALVVGVLSALGVLTSSMGGCTARHRALARVVQRGQRVLAPSTPAVTSCSATCSCGAGCGGDAPSGGSGAGDELLREAGHADSARTTELLRELGAALDAPGSVPGRSLAARGALLRRSIAQRHEPARRAGGTRKGHRDGPSTSASCASQREVVNKRGRLTNAEFKLMKQHAAAGGEMVECAPETLSWPRRCAGITNAGTAAATRTGSPVTQGIPVEARMISVADTFDAITSARPYRAATPHAEALKVIAEEASRRVRPGGSAGVQPQLLLGSARRRAVGGAGVDAARQICRRPVRPPARPNCPGCCPPRHSPRHLSWSPRQSAPRRRPSDQATIRRRRNSRRLLPPSRLPPPQRNRPSSTAPATVAPASQTATSTSTAREPSGGAVAGVSGRSSPDRAAASASPGLSIADPGEPVAAGCAATTGAVAHAGRGRPIAAYADPDRDAAPDGHTDRERGAAAEPDDRTAAHAGAVAAAVRQHAAGVSHGDSDADTALAHRRRLQERRLDGPRLPGTRAGASPPRTSRDLSSSRRRRSSELAGRSRRR